MPTIQRIDTETAQRFTAEHWPLYNATQGIVWEQRDYALAEYKAQACVGVAIYKVVGGLAQLEQLVVAHGRTKQGIGSRLLRAFEAHALELGCHLIQLETAQTQAPGFYERHGYERVFTCRDGKFGLDWFWYAKRLSR